MTQPMVLRYCRQGNPESGSHSSDWECLVRIQEASQTKGKKEEGAGEPAAGSQWLAIHAILSLVSLCWNMIHVWYMLH